MSDPVVNIEIEDVLASIRRLVSEGDAPKRQQAARPPARQTEGASRDLPNVTAPPEATANISAAPEKLVLSPEQMVELPQQDISDPLVLDASAEADNVEEIAAPIEDVVAPPSLATWHNLDPLPEEDTAASPEVSETEPPDEAASDEEGPTLEVINTDARSQLLSTIEELEAAVTENDDDFEPDGSEEAPIVDWSKTTENGAIFGARAATTRVVDIARPVEDGPEGTKEDLEPDNIVSETPRAATLAEVRRLARDEINRATSTLDDELDEFIAADAAIDQEQLRSMVVAIVREELQGALGERITRNVRKLVRREIYRILASEDFS